MLTEKELEESLKQEKLWDLNDGEPPKDFEGLQFRFSSLDSVGTSCGNKWGYVSRVYPGKQSLKIKPQFVTVFGRLQGEKAVLLKQSDGDYSDISVNEWLYSQLGRLLLDEVKVPRIKRVYYKYDNSMLSYSLLTDLHNEELFHMEDIISLKLGDPQQQKYYSSFGINDILECMHKFVDNPEDAKRIETGIITTTILDCITNNVDRHGKNWGVIRHSLDNSYDLFAVDHSLAFTNMIDPRPGVVDPSGYPNSVVASTTSKGKPESARKTLAYIQKNFPEEFELMTQRMKDYISEIEQVCKIAEKKLGIRGLTGTIIGRCNKAINHEYTDRGSMEHE